jgi:hypothetical protein
LNATANDTTSPEGVQNAYKMAQTGGFTTAPNINFGGLTASTYTISIFAKAGTRNFLASSLDGVTYFNLSNGTIGTTSPNHTAKIENYGSGWYRCSITRTTTTTQTAAFYFADTNGTLTTADDGGYMYTYGAMAESSASYSSSYIPTYGLSVTRNSESCRKTGVGSLIGSAAGTIYLEAAALANDLSERRFAVSNGTTGNVARVGFTNINNRILAVLYNGANQCVLSYSSADITQMNKIAFTWAENDFALFVNGVKRSSDTFGSTFAANTLTEIHFNEGDGSGNDMYGEFNQVLLFTSRLSDTELATLTA